jgi:hypothetical protein
MDTMRTSVGIPSSLIVGLIAALVGARVMLSTSEAGDRSRSPPETGYPSYLINKPTCGTGDTCDASQRFQDTYGGDFLSLNPEME